MEKTENRKKIKHKIKKIMNYKIFFICERSFSIIETIIVISIIAILASVFLPFIQSAKSKAYYVRSKADFNSMSTALELYKGDHNGEYPPDVDRNIPSELAPYLTGQQGQGNWPNGPWPGSVYDWDNWTHGIDGKIYQISIRFCPAGGQLSECKFPKQSWAEDFKVNSSVYFCLSGKCRAHINEPINYPGYCINCEED